MAEPARWRDTHPRDWGMMSASAKAMARQPSLLRLACLAEALKESEGPCRGIPRPNLIPRINFSATADRLGMVGGEGLEPPTLSV